MLAVIIKGEEYNGEQLAVRGQRFSIGRAMSSDLVLRDKSASSLHAQLLLRNDVIWLQDLGSRNGTQIRRKNIIQEQIAPGDGFTIGPYSIRLTRLEESTAERKTATLKEIYRDLHAQLIMQLNLKQLSLTQMRDESLRERAGTVLDQLLTENEYDLPENLETSELKKSILDMALGLGPLEELLANPSITEVMVNGPAQIYIEQSGKLERADCAFLGEQEILTAIERIVGPIGRRIDESSPLVDARLADGSRVNAIIPPLALDGPTLTIRKFPEKRMLIENLLEYAALTRPMADFLELCVTSSKNVLISGGTGSGKTTLLNILSSFIPPDERIVTIEDSAELQLPQDHVVRLETRPPNIEGKGEFTIRDLVKNALRMRPDRIVVGECRGGETLDMVQAMNTGHDGSLTTAHANSPEDMIRRLETMIMMAGMELPLKAVRENIYSAIDMIIQISRIADGSRKITSISEISAIYKGEIQLQEIFKFERTHTDEHGQIQGIHTATGLIPSFVDELRQSGQNIDMSIFVPYKE